MKRMYTDVRLLAALLLVHLLMYFTFMDRSIFWYIFSGTMLFLISYAIIHEHMEDQQSFWKYVFYGILSGIALYGLFWLGYTLMTAVNIPIAGSVDKLYSRFSPKTLWHYLALLLIIIPGEELFWRGFVQKRILTYSTINIGIILSAILYASVAFYSGTWVLALASLIGGLFWGWLYVWKKSMPMLIVSHLVFDLLLFVLLPLK